MHLCIVLSRFLRFRVGEVKDETESREPTGFSERGITHLDGFASMPTFRRAKASSVFPMLFVHTYAMYLASKA